MELSGGMAERGYEPEGLEVVLTRLVHTRDAAHLPAATPHAFVYFLTIRNRGTATVQLLGRRWVISHADGRTDVFEGDKIVGEEPLLGPGEEFSYNSFHVLGASAEARGSFHGLDAAGQRVYVRIPPFQMYVPEDADE